jgi:Na+/phosphate symporter
MDKINNYEEITSLDFNEKLKSLLIIYVRINYEETADYSDDSLMNEYRYLLNNNQLNVLFQCEKLENLFSINE